MRKAKGGNPERGESALWFWTIVGLNSEIFENAISNVNYLMDINQYINFKFEMDMIKEILFDKYQNEVFQIISNIMNFDSLFQYERFQKIATKLKKNSFLKNENWVQL